MRKGLLTGMTVAALGAALVLPGTSMGVVTIGSDLGNAPTAMDTICSIPSPPGCTAAHNGAMSLPPASQAGGGLSAPISGVVVRFRLQSANNAGAPVVFRVLRPTANPSSVRGAGTSAAITPLTGLNVLETRLPIAGGDSIGVNCCASAMAAHQFFFINAGAGAATVWGGIAGGPVVDGTERSPDSAFLNSEMLVNADIEPDADNDGFGDETQDKCLTQPNTQTACRNDFSLTVTPGKGGSVLVNATVPGSGSIRAGDSLDKSLAARRKKKKKPLLKKASAVPSAPGPVSLTLNPKKRLKKLLRKKKKGVPVTVKVIYSPDGAATVSQAVKVTLRK